MIDAEKIELLENQLELATRQAQEVYNDLILTGYVISALMDKVGLDEILNGTENASFMKITAIITRKMAAIGAKGNIEKQFAFLKAVSPLLDKYGPAIQEYKNKVEEKSNERA